MLSKSTLLKIVINTLIGGILVTVWLQFVNLGEILDTLKKVQFISVLPIFLAMFTSVLLRAFRFKILLAPLAKTRLSDLTFLTGFAMMLSFLIPIRAGEIAKGIYLNNVYKLPIAKSIIWVFLDRFLDFLIVLVLGSVLLLVIPTALSKNITIITFITVIIFILVFYLMVFQTNFAKKMFKFLSHLLIVSSIKIYFERLCSFFLDTFIILKRSPKDLAILVGITILAYAADAFIWYFSFVAIGSVQPFINMYLGQMLSALTYLIPAAPGYVGSAEASGILIFSGVFGINTNIASAMVVLFHVLTLVWILVFGIISVYFLKIDLGVILRKIFRREIR